MTEEEDDESGRPGRVGRGETRERGRPAAPLQMEFCWRLEGTYYYVLGFVEGKPKGGGRRWIYVAFERWGR